MPAGFALRGSGGRAYRVPNFLELFGDRGAIVGNPGLNAERSWNFDAGLLWTQRPYRLAMTYFENRLTNLIQFLQTSQLTARATNLAAATIRGFEFEAEAHPFTWLQLTSNYTFQWAKDTSGRAGFDGQFLPGRAQHQLNFSANFPIRWGRFYAALDFIDSNFLDSLNTLKVERRSLLSVGATARPWKWLTAGFEIKNLLSEKIEDVVGFPVPGRLFFGNLTVTI